MMEDVYLVNPKTGSRHRLNGCKPSFRSSNLPSFASARIYADRDLPLSVDLRVKMTPIENQSTTNSCVANALAGAYEFLVKKRTGKEIDVSRLFIYYNARRKDDPDLFEMEDVGCSISGAIEALKEFGCCKEEIFPFDEKKVNEKPSEYCYSQARQYRLIDGMEINVQLNEMKACLAQNHPFVFCLSTFASFAESESNGGHVLMPQANENQNSSHGFHAMLAVGYNDQSKSFIVRNSWGKRWGDGGYLYIPYDYMSNTDFCSDLYAIKAISANDSSSGYPSIEPVVNPVDDPNSSFYDIDNREEFDFNHSNKWTNPNNSWSETSVNNVVDDFYSDDYFWNRTDSSYSEPLMSSGSNSKSFPTTTMKLTANNTRAYIERIPRAKTRHVNLILWIDSKNGENANLVNELKIDDSSIQIDFCESLAKTKEYLKEHIQQIQGNSSTFQIVCRGFYRRENQNPLDLLLLLGEYKLRDIPIIVLTQDKEGVRYHLTNQGPSFGINDWHNRLHITSNPIEVKNKCKNFIASKSRTFSHR